MRRRVIVDPYTPGRHVNAMTIDDDTGKRIFVFPRPGSVVVGVCERKKAASVLLRVEEVDDLLAALRDASAVAGGKP